MKIALATGNYKNVVGHPGRCKGFIVYEIEDGKIINKEERENTFQHNHNHEHGGNHDEHGGHGTMGQPIAAMLQDCDYFIAKTMGQGFVNQLQRFGVKPAVVENINDAETAAMQLLEHLKN